MVDKQEPNAESGAKSNDNQLRDVSKRLNDVMGLLRIQRDTLRKRGINLPTGAMDSLRTLRKRLETLSRTVADSQQELVSLRALAKTSALINSERNVDDVLNQVMDTVISLTGAERGYIMLRDPKTGILEPEVARGMDAASLDSSEGVIVSRTIVNMVADSGEPILTDNASMDERYQRQESVAGLKLRSILAVPLKSHDQVIGVVYCDNRIMSGLFKQHELGVLTSFANQAVVAIENATLFESVRDRLAEVTEIQNRMGNLFDSVTSGIITVDENGLILVANQTAESITHQKDIEGQLLKDILPAMGDSFYAMLETVRTTETQHGKDYDDLLVDNASRSWAVIASPLRGENGTQGVALVIEDLTEQRKSEMQIRETRRYMPPALVDTLKGVDINTVGSEEREITAVFADIRGFTSFSEKLEPDALMSIINKYLSLASDAITFGEGIVDKYMGDAVTGLFNTQLNPQTDHAARAVQTALHLVHDMNGMHLNMESDGLSNEIVHFGIGIHTGPAVLGNVGGKDRKEFSALGEAMDICKYLQEQAGAGEVAISEYTYDQVRDHFECEEILEPARPKEAYQHIKCYKVVKTKKAVILDPELADLKAEMADFLDEFGDLSDLVADLDD
ncbi:MAG: adenylate/guanylate cyclase domain-containing protein [Anaerolineae bacterium]|nr:adenylate/guanylate cyclase domain-containing protein [Anaerolineae bacterium]